MKRFILSMFFIVGSLVMFTATGNAQIDRKYSAKVPFDFTVGNKHLKAGDYQISPLSGATDVRFIELINLSDRATNVIGSASIRSDGSEPGHSLNFIEVGNEWVLRSIDTPGFSVKARKYKQVDSKVALNRDSRSYRSVAVQ